MRATIQRSFYRNGQLREEVPLRNGQRHGVVRTWHKNGVLASEERFQDGALHGVCRQWDEDGRLLGKYRMVHGTGVQRGWHDNGQLQIEISTLRGEFCGRNRIWLRDGTLLSERFYLNGRVVSAETYRGAAAKDKALPKFRGPSAGLRRKEHATEKHIHRVFTKSLLEKAHRCDAREWLHKNGVPQATHSLGRFKKERDAAKFVQELYQAGAAKVIVPDIYGNKNGGQFADGLLVQLPKDAKRRKAVRMVCAKLQKRKLGAFEPDEDIGESYLYLSMT